MVEAAPSAVEACWSSALFFQPGCHTHIPQNSLLLGNTLSEKCSATQKVGEERNNMFSLYILKISFIALQLSHCLLISHWFYNRNESSRDGVKEENKYVEAGGGLVKQAQEMTSRNAKQSRHGHCCMMCVGSPKWK